MLSEDFITKFGELEERIEKLNAEDRKTYARLGSSYTNVIDRVYARKILLNRAHEYAYYGQGAAGPLGSRDMEGKAIAILERAIEINYQSANEAIADSRSEADQIIHATFGL